MPYEYKTASTAPGSTGTDGAALMTVSEECKAQQAGDRAYLDYRDMYDSDKNGFVGMDDFRYVLITTANADHYC